MKKIKLEDKVFYAPETWYDVKLETYNKLEALENSTEDTDTIDYTTKFLAIVFGSTEEEIASLSEQNFLYLFKIAHEFTTSEIPRADNNIIKINGKTFVFDNVIRATDTAMFIDLNNITKDDNFMEVAHKVAAIFIRPVKKEKDFILSGKKALGFKVKKSDYKVMPYDYEQAQLNSLLFYEELSMPYYIEVAGFFLSLPDKLKKTFQSSILQKISKKETQNQ